MSCGGARSPFDASCFDTSLPSKTHLLPQTFTAQIKRRARVITTHTQSSTQHAETGYLSLASRGARAPVVLFALQFRWQTENQSDRVITVISANGYFCRTVLLRVNCTSTDTASNRAGGRLPAMGLALVQKVHTHRRTPRSTEMCVHSSLSSSSSLSLSCSFAQMLIKRAALHVE